MIIFKNFEMYIEVNLPKDGLLQETMNFFENLPDLEEIPGERFWIVKIVSKPILEDNFITHWPCNELIKELIKRYCLKLENTKILLPNTHILVKAGYMTEIEILNPVKYQKLIHLINEFKKTNNTLIQNS